jgi:hypothetical protein
MMVDNHSTRQYNPEDSSERIYSLFLRVDKRTLVSIEKEFEVLKVKVLTFCF